MFNHIENLSNLIDVVSDLERQGLNVIEASSADHFGTRVFVSNRTPPEYPSESVHSRPYGEGYIYRYVKDRGVEVFWLVEVADCGEAA